MRALTPWTDRLSGRARNGDSSVRSRVGEWVPALDVSETKDAMVVKAQVPRMDPQDTPLTLQHLTVTLTRSGGV
jgi:HSP20 family molecular chaperone IbpA